MDGRRYPTKLGKVKRTLADYYVSMHPYKERRYLILKKVPLKKFIAVFTFFSLCVSFKITN